MLDYYIAGGILVVCILGFFYFLNREKYRRSHSIDHYQEQRDEMTLDDAGEAEEETEEEETEEVLSTSLGNIFGIISIALILVITIGVVLPTAYDVVLNIKSSSNVSSGFSDGNINTVLDSLPIFTIIGVVGGIGTIIFRMVGGGEEKSPDKRPRAIKHYAGMRDELTRRSTRKSAKRRGKSVPKVVKEIDSDDDDEA